MKSKSPADKNNRPSPKKPVIIGRSVLREEISRIVMERILDGTYPPGSRIVESSLAKEFGTSQAPAREALRDLEGMNLIETQHHKGARVRELDPGRFRQIYPVRAALEELAGRTAAASMNDEILALLEIELNALRTTADEGNAHQQMIHDARFHEIIVESANNEVLLEIWRSLRIESGTFVSMLRADWDLHMIAEKHTALFDAMKARDPNAAAREMRLHIDFFSSLVQKEGENASEPVEKDS